jgi:hypothetical protein
MKSQSSTLGDWLFWDLETVLVKHENRPHFQKVSQISHNFTLTPLSFYPFSSYIDCERVVHGKCRLNRVALRILRNIHSLVH